MRSYAFVGCVVLAGCRPSLGAAAQPVAPTDTSLTAAVEPAAPAEDAVATPASRATCRGDSARALSLLPESARTVVELDLEAIVHAPQFQRRYRDVIPRDDLDLIEVASACGLGFDSWRMFTASEGGSAPMKVFQGEGIGEPERLACVAEKLGTEEGAVSFSSASIEGRTRLSFDNGDVAWVVDRCTLVVTNAAHEPDLKRVLSGEARSLLAAGTLAGPLQRLPAVRQIAMVSLDAALLTVSGGPPPRGDLALAIGLRRGLELVATLEVAAPADAERSATGLREMLVQVRSTVATLGMPETVIDGVKVRTDGRVVRIDAAATPAEFDAMIDGVVRMFGGGPSRVEPPRAPGA